MIAVRLGVSSVAPMHFLDQLVHEAVPCVCGDDLSHCEFV